MPAARVHSAVCSVIQLQNIQKSFQVAGREVQALSGIDLSIGAGEIFGIIGHSGAGKSTLVRVINLLERPTGGSVIIDGIEITSLQSEALRSTRQGIGMIFQHFNLLSSKTVAENVAWPLKIAGWDKANIPPRVTELLARVGLLDHADKYPAQLSGGQKQRVGIARALATRPKLLLCDEATSALDPQTTRSVLDLLADINRELGLTIVLITHEMDVVRRICDRVAVLDSGRVVELGPVTEVFLHPKHSTTRSFVMEAEHVDEHEQHDDFAHVPGRIARLTFKGNATYEPLLGEVARSTGIDFSILTGRIDRIKDSPYGQLTVAFTAGDIDGALSQLAERGIVVEELR